jgi:hypothetical protein
LISKSLKALFSGILTGSFSGIFYGLLISALPVLLVKHRKPAEFFTDQPIERWGFYCIVIIASTATFAKTYLDRSSRSGIDQTSVNESNDPANEANVVVHPLRIWLKKYGFELTATMYLFWYTACAALCEKLRIMLLPDALAHKEVIFGLIFVAIAAIVLLRTVFIQDTVTGTKPNPWRVAHPIYAAGLIYAFGVPFLFQTWFPLVAIPGAVVCLKWQLGAKSATTSGISRKWQVIPFVY